MSKSIRRGALVSLLAVATLAGLDSACTVASKDIFTTQVGTRANAGDFRSAGVTTVFEKRCGSLDCHGSVARNMRIYSTGGLRLPNEAGAAPGQGATTLEEITANYLSISNLEPEQMTEVVTHGADPYSLLVLKKPLELERHKGGPAITRGDDAETCIVSWLKAGSGNTVDKNSCAKAAIFPNP
jgi:hypothetical protein